MSPTTEIPLNIRALLRLIAPSPEMGQGFGLGFAVRTAEGRNPAPGSVGDFYWAGASGVYFWVDPEQQLAVVAFTAQSEFSTKIIYRQLIRQLVYQALEDPAPTKRSPEEETVFYQRKRKQEQAQAGTEGLTP